MYKRTTLAGLSGLLTGALVAAGCNDSLSPEHRGPGAPQFATTAATGIALDRKTGSVDAQEPPTTLLGKGFNLPESNPHRGDAIIASFFWVGGGPTNIIDSVYDQLSNGTRVGNTYNFVQFVNAGGISMATYVATNVQNFPDPYPPPGSNNQDSIYVVLAHLSTPVTDGGAMLSAYVGVQPVFAQALGDTVSNSGGGNTTTTTTFPRALNVGAGALAYGVSMSSPVANMQGPPSPPWTNIFPLSDNTIKADGEFQVFADAGTANPQWTWFYTSPGTWLASGLVLNPAAAAPPSNKPPVASFTSSCTGVACTFTSTSSDPDGSITAYSWDFGDGATSTLQSPSHTYGAEGSYTVTLTVTDDQGATNSSSQSVTVTASNQAPTVNAGPNQTVLVGLLYTLDWSFSDPDNDGPWSYTIDWGDGSSSSGSTATQGSFSTGHTYLLPLGTHTIRVTVTDSRGASGSDTKTVTVIL